MKLLTQDRLKELLHYNPDTGGFTRLVKTNGSCILGVIDNPPCRTFGYIFISVMGKLYRAHRLAFLYMNGRFPEDQVDHINHIKHDNRWINLRESSQQMNSRNQSISRTNTSGVTGVSWDKKNMKWAAQIVVNGKNKKIGRFNRIEEAAIARKEAEIKYGFHINHGKK